MTVSAESQRRVENTKVHFDAISPVSVNNFHSLCIFACIGSSKCFKLKDTGYLKPIYELIPFIINICDFDEKKNDRKSGVTLSVSH